MFTTRKIESLTLGKILKETRLSLGLSLQKCSRVLKIQQKYLERLERGLYDKLPADVYTKNFVKKYARLLKLDAEQIIPYYHRERELDERLRTQKISPRPLRSARFTITPKSLILFVLSLFFLFTAGYIFYQLMKLIGGPFIVLVHPSEDMTTASDKIEITGKTDPSAYLTINGQAVNLEGDGNFREILSLQPNLNIIRLEAVNRFGKKTTKIRQIIKEN